MTRIEQLNSEAEDVLAGETDDDILLRASTLLAEHRRTLTDVERKLRECQ